MSNRLHVDDSLEFKLKIIEEYDETSKKFIVKQKDFDKKSFYKKYGKLFKTIPFFVVTDEELFYACRCIDEWIEDKYKNDQDILTRYRVHNIVPKELHTRSTLPVTLRPYWDILFSINQNRWCNFQILKNRIPGFEDVDIKIFAGYKATSPFDHDNKTHYLIVTLSGKMQDIDRLTKDYRL